MPNSLAWSPPELAARVRSAAIGLLARREHSRQELQIKLEARDFPVTIISEVLEALAIEGLQSDVRFSESYTRLRAGRGFGPERIAKELALRGVDDGIVAAAVFGSGVDWSERLHSVWQKRFHAQSPEDGADRARQQRFLRYRGFTFEAIAALLGCQSTT